MPTWMSVSFQDSNSMNMEQLLFFHDHSMIILVIITTTTLYMIIISMKNKTFNKFLSEGQEIETIWTILPSLMLIFIAMPSMKALYLMEETSNPALTMKCIGHQWYWSYEYSDLINVQTDSFMEGHNLPRLLKTSQSIILPAQTNNRLLITSSDVIHAWTMPSMGVKVDALPGRLNQAFISTKRMGNYMGQCSEICGTNHSFMPINLEVTSIKMMKEKIKSM